MICGSCKTTVPDVAHVRACYAARTPAAPAAVPAPRVSDKADNPTLAWARANVPNRTPVYGGTPTAPAPQAVTQTLTTVPAARYALGEGDDVRFYRVDCPTEGKWAGYTFVSVLASDDAHPIRNRATRERVLSEIARDPEAALRRYGREIGACGHCGRTLTNAESRAEGLGPVCASKWR